MTSPTSPTPAGAGATRVRIASHITQSRFLHVEDSLEIGKLRFFSGTYRRGQGLESHAQHYLDLADARVIFAALARGEPGFSHKEYKGTPPVNGAAAVSRVLSVTSKGENVYLELKSGPGKLTPTGAITPAGPATTAVNVGCKLYEARRLAATVLAYIRAWDVQRMLAIQRQVGAPAPYLQVAAGSSGPRPGANGNGTARPTAAHDLPVTARTPSSKTNGPHRPVAPTPPAAPASPAAAPVRVPARVAATAEALYGDGDLRYGDGTAVDAQNAAEVQAYRRYAAQFDEAPATRAALQAFYRGRVANGR